MAATGPAARGITETGLATWLDRWNHRVRDRRLCERAEKWLRSHLDRNGVPHTVVAYLVMFEVQQQAATETGHDASALTTLAAHAQHHRKCVATNEARVMPINAIPSTEYRHPFGGTGIGKTSTDPLRRPTWSASSRGPTTISSAKSCANCRGDRSRTPNPQTTGSPGPYVIPSKHRSRIRGGPGPVVGQAFVEDPALSWAKHGALVNLAAALDARVITPGSSPPRRGSTADPRAHVSSLITSEPPPRHQYRRPPGRPWRRPHLTPPSTTHGPTTTLTSSSPAAPQPHPHPPRGRHHRRPCLLSYPHTPPIRTHLWSQPDHLWAPSRPIASGPTSPPPSATHALARHPPPDPPRHHRRPPMRWLDTRLRTDHDIYTQTPSRYPPWHRLHPATASPCRPHHGSTPRRRQLHVADPRAGRQPEHAHSDHAFGPEQHGPPDSTRLLAPPSPFTIFLLPTHLGHGPGGRHRRLYMLVSALRHANKSHLSFGTSLNCYKGGDFEAC